MLHFCLIWAPICIGKYFTMDLPVRNPKIPSHGCCCSPRYLTFGWTLDHDHGVRAMGLARTLTSILTLILEVIALFGKFGTFWGVACCCCCRKYLILYYFVELSETSLKTLFPSNWTCALLHNNRLKMTLRGSLYAAPAVVVVVLQIWTLVEFVVWGRQTKTWVCCGLWPWPWPWKYRTKKFVLFLH